MWGGELCKDRLTDKKKTNERTKLHLFCLGPKKTRGDSVSRIRCMILFVSSIGGATGFSDRIVTILELMIRRLL